jgi:hypothetical protein
MTAATTQLLHPVMILDGGQMVLGNMLLAQLSPQHSLVIETAWTFHEAAGTTPPR